MIDEDETKEQLIDNLVQLREQIAGLEATKTSRTQAEEALRKGGKVYRHFFEESPIGICLVTPDGKIIAGNKAMETIFGYSVEELKKIELAKCYENPEDTKKVTEAVKRYGGVVNFPIRLKSKDGIAFNSLLTIFRIDHSGREDLFGAICININERKREEEEEYRSIIRTTMDGFWIVDMQERFLDVNDAYCRLIGYSRDELLTMRISDVEAVERPKEMARHIQKIMEVGGDRFETQHRCKDGRIIDIEVSVNYMEVGGGRMFVFLRDITDRKRAEEALWKQTMRNELVLETAIDGFAVVDMGGKILEVNNAMSAISGYSREELVKMNIRGLEALETPRETTRHIRKVMREGCVRFETRHRRKDRQVVDVEVSADFIKMDGQKVFFCFFRDITERKRANRALREKEEELEDKTKNLVEVNTALRVLLKRREEDKRELEEKVLLNVKETVMPYLEKFERSGLNERQETYLSILKSNLNDIVSPFLRLFSLSLRLTPTEMGVANFIRHGKTTKEIAELMNLSSRTIDTHRENIRKKLGIKNKKANLRTHLLTIQLHNT